jgi:hypothetical protein
MDLCCSYGGADPLVFLATFRVVRVVLLWASFILLEVHRLDAMGKLATGVLCELRSAFVFGGRNITQYMHFVQ